MIAMLLVMISSTSRTHLRKLFTFTLLCALPVSVWAEREVYVIDPVHSGVEFRIGHFFNQVPGRFNEFAGELHLDRENLANSVVQATIQVASIDTANGDRDNHLRTDDFFDAETFPEITFVSTSWEETGENSFAVTGDLTIRDVTREVTLDARVLGFGQGRGETMVTGWDARGKIDRTDFGITYGRPVIGTEVEIVLSVQGHKN